MWCKLSMETDEPENTKNEQKPESTEDESDWSSEIYSSCSRPKVRSPIDPIPFVNAVLIHGAVHRPVRTAWLGRQATPPRIPDNRPWRAKMGAVLVPHANSKGMPLLSMSGNQCYFWTNRTVKLCDRTPRYNFVEWPCFIYLEPAVLSTAYFQFHLCHVCKPHSGLAPQVATVYAYMIIS